MYMLPATPSMSGKAGVFGFRQEQAVSWLGVKAQPGTIGIDFISITN